MTLKSSQILMLTASALALTACSGGGHSVTVTPPAPAPVARLEDGFGTGFGTDYRTTANSEPVKPAASDIVALSLTTEPTALH